MRRKVDPRRWVMTEAMRLAKGIVVKEMKARKVKVSDCTAREINERARAYLKANPELAWVAQVNIARMMMEGYL